MMLEQYEEALLKQMIKKYQHSFASVEFSQPGWDFLVKTGYPMLKLGQRFNGYGLPDKQQDLFIFELAKSDSIQPDLINKLFYLDIVNSSEQDSLTKDIESIVGSSDDMFFVFPNDDKGFVDHQIIINGYIGSVFSTNNKNSFILNVVINNKIYVFLLPSYTVGIRINDLTIMNKPVKSIIGNSLRLDLNEALLSFTVENQAPYFLIQRLNRILFFYALGFCEKMLDLLKARIMKRKQFFKTLSEFQSIRFSYAKLYADLSILKAQINDLNQGDGIDRCQIMLAKNLLQRCMKTSMQYFGAYGLLSESSISHYYRFGGHLILNINQILERTRHDY